MMTPREGAALQAEVIRLERELKAAQEDLLEMAHIILEQREEIARLKRLLGLE